MKFYKYQLPVAYSIIASTKGIILEQLQPFQHFVCYWTAFNNIYVTIADNKGQRVQQRIKKGVPVTRTIASVIIPVVDMMPEGQ